MSLDRDTIITLGSSLPPAVGIFGRLEVLLQKADADLGQIVELVRVDPALTFQIIRLGNSAYYGLREPCESLEAAVSRIGFRDIHSLVGFVAARHACQKELSAYQVTAQRFWENAVATGLIMAALATQNGMDARGAYSTGLLRNIGRTILNNHAGAVRYPGAETEPSLSAWEKSTYKITASEVGALLLEHWRFTDGTVAAVRAFADPSMPDLPLTAAMLHLAAGTTESWGFGFPGESGLWHLEVGMYERAGLTADTFARAVEEARQNFQRMADLAWSQAA